MFMNKKCIVFCTYAITPRLMCYVSLKPLVRINEGNMVKLNKAKKKKKSSELLMVFWKLVGSLLRRENNCLGCLYMIKKEPFARGEGEGVGE